MLKLKEIRTTKRVHMTRATGRWPLGRQGRTCVFQENQRRLAPTRRLKSEGHLSTCPCLVKTIKTAGLFGYCLVSCFCLRQTDILHNKDPLTGSLRLARAHVASLVVTIKYGRPPPWGIFQVKIAQNGKGLREVKHAVGHIKGNMRGRDKELQESGANRE